MTQSHPSPSRSHPTYAQPQHASTLTSRAPPSTFPTAGAAVPAAVTSASALAASPPHAATSAINALSAPKLTPPQRTQAAAAAAASSSAMTTQPTPPPQQPSTAPAASGRAAAAAEASISAPAAVGPKVLPYLFDDAQLDDVLVLVVDMLVKLTEHNDSLPLHPSALTRFHSRATPNISLSAYLRRMAKYTSIEKCCVLILLVYIDRVCERLDGFTICGLTVHRFICAAILCASKALCDAFNTNEHYAKVGGISLQEINLLEKEFLQIIDWRLICSGAVLQHYYASLVRSHSSYVLAPPPANLDSAMDEDEANLPRTQSFSGSSSSSGSASAHRAKLVAPADALAGDSTRLIASAATTPAIGAGQSSSQHSSPFPISSSSASPFTPAVAGAANDLIRANGGRLAASRSGSSASPSSAMQVDPVDPVDPRATSSAIPSRRRKDEQRTPPSPPRSAHSGLHPTSGPSAAADGTAQDEAFKRTRFDHRPPPPPQ